MACSKRLASRGRILRSEYSEGSKSSKSCCTYAPSSLSTGAKRYKRQASSQPRNVGSSALPSKPASFL